MKIQNSELSQPLGRQIGHTAKYYFKAISRVFKDQDIPLTAEQGILLFKIYSKEGVSQNELADHMMKDKPSITRAIDHLENSGFVMRVPDPRDRRVKLLYISPEGKNILPQFHELARNLEQTATMGIPENDVLIMKKTLAKIRKNLKTINLNGLIDVNNSCK